ncbi:CHAT domain-containing protein [Tamlana sp. 2_MG-2023]|uniref:CHAT domain-containing protein n=1 Tax=unclassified Tamlana TaxID=2614803 RepID=UPI0026E44FFF|nr:MULTISPECIES: CHAT domain-containing tetratricopeptide repeat protein [unclassified Tamlana]MDO6759892.1 CHAT domain-containing protein [Tamlana sp. 2_MG-2023]MDO6791938.1 CHAT domain-containing protein [Tamlana sp. 1_MG-2023]
MKKLVFILFLVQGFGFSQNLEENIYVAAETFSKQQNEATFQLLNEQASKFEKLIKSKDEHLAFVFLQCQKGYYLNEKSKLKDAITTYENALSRYNNQKLSTFSDFDIIEYCLKPLGNLYTKTNDFTNAESTINQYIFLAEKEKNIRQQMSGAINLAKLFQTLGNHEAVIKVVDNALKQANIPASKKAHLESIKTTSFIAINDYKIASSQNISSNASSFDIEKTKSQIELKNGNYNAALTHFNKAKTLLNREELGTRDLAKFYFQEAQLYFLLQKNNEALKKLNEALKILLPNYSADGLPNKNQLYAENTFIDIFDLYAELQTLPNNILQLYDLSFHVSNLLRDHWTSQETKIINETQNRKRSEKCINILFDYYNQTNKGSLLFKALQYAENNKVSTLKSIFQKKLRLQRFPNDSLLNTEFNLLKNQERIKTQLIKAQLTSYNASYINNLNQQLSTISVQLKTVKNAINKKFSEEENTFSLETLQHKLTQNNTALTEYFFGEQNLYQFVITADAIALNKIDLDEKKKNAIRSYIHLFESSSAINNDIGYYTNQAFHVYNLLNFNALSAYQNVIIIPDGLLNFIPFEALLSDKTKTTSFSKMPFVVKNHQVAYNTSISFYLNTLEKNTNNTLIGFFPVFENTNQTLNYSIDEAHAIEKEMPSKLYMNADATKSNFMKNASKHGIIHLSTHASAGNFIQPANMKFYDDSLLLNELYSMTIPANLVVMSACETGVGRQFKGEGAMSIARGFQYAGAKNLLFSLWQINDLSTSEIMKSFYKSYNKHESAWLANHESKINYLEKETINNIKKSPYYWSAFVYYGSLETAKPQNTIFYIIFGIVIILIALLLMLKFKNHE